MSDSTLFFGGQIVTIDPDMPYAEAVLIDKGTIVFVGSLNQALTLTYSSTEEVDLAGSTLLPGFIDAHSHPLWSAKTRGAPVVDIRAETVPTFDAILAKIERRVAAARPNEHLLFFGLDAQLHDGFQTLTREWLNQMAPQNPLGVQTSNCHELYMNSAGFKACGITAETPTPIGSVVERASKGSRLERLLKQLHGKLLRLSMRLGEMID